MGRPVKILLYYWVILISFLCLYQLVSVWDKKEPLSGVVDQQQDSVLRDSLLEELSTPVDSIIEKEIKEHRIDADSALYSNKYLFYYPVFKRQIEAFISKAEKSVDNNKVVRIVHMGDSQIEGDRITQYIREAFQQRFGGRGPGLITVYDPQKLNPSIWLDQYGEWQIHRVYDKTHKLLGGAYGIMGITAAFNPVVSSGFRIKPSPWAEPLAKRYYKVRLFLGPLEKMMAIDGYLGESKIIQDTLPSEKGLTEINWEFSEEVPRLKLLFHAEKSPLFLGCALDSTAGVAVDNLALRGQSTPHLERTSHELFKTMAKHLNIGLVIFQFGTNMVPTRASNFVFYQRQLEKQFSLLKELILIVPLLLSEPVTRLI